MHVCFEQQWKRIETHKHIHHRTCEIVNGSGCVGLAPTQCFKDFFYFLIFFLMFYDFTSNTFTVISHFGG